MKLRSLALTLTLALAAIPAVAHADDDEVRDSVRKVLGDKDYRFCHEPEYPLDVDEHEWCSLVGEKSDVCPKLPEACKREPVARGFHRRPTYGSHSGEGEPVDRPPQEDTRQRSLDLSALSGLASVLFWVVIAGFVGLVIYLIVTNLTRGRSGPKQPEDEKAPAPEERREDAEARKQIETDVERLLARARAAAARGEFGPAIDDAYAALLRRLDGDGLIEIHASRTNGDYVRSLRKPELRSAVRAIARDVEGVQFGATAPSESVFRTVMERVLPLVGRALVLALLFLGLSSSTSCKHFGDDGDVGDNSPSGTQALIDVLEKNGFHARRRSEAITKLDRPLTLVLLSDTSLDQAKWDHLVTWMNDTGGTLVLAGTPKLPPAIDLEDAEDTESSTDIVPEWTRGITGVLPRGRRLMSKAGGPPEDGYMVRRGKSVAALSRRMGTGRLVAFADDRFFTNISLTAAQNAELLVNILKLPVTHDEVELCDQWTGLGAANPIDSVQRAELTPVLLQILAVIALLFLWKGIAFARLRDPPSAGRRAFADHARALGLAYSRGRASRHAAGLYAVWALDRLRERVHRSGRQGLIPLAEAIAARTGRPESEVMRVLVEASGARDDAAPPSSFRPSLRPGGRAPRRDDTAVADFALVRELQSFLAATGQRSADKKNTSPER